MQYGHFDDLRREYVITTPQLPQPWINYLGNGELVSLVSHTGGGYTYYRDARLRRLTRYRYQGVPRDIGSRNVYIYESGMLWSPLWKPMCCPLDQYSCRHGSGYTIITSEFQGLRMTMTCFIPIDGNVEIHDLKIENRSERQRDIQLYSCVEFCLWDAEDDMTNFQRNLNIGEVHIEDNMICHISEYRERRNHFSWYAVNQTPAGFDTDLETFLGNNRGYDRPLVPQSGGSENSIASGWSPIAAFRIPLSIEPLKAKRVIFQLGYTENDREKKWREDGTICTERARKLMERFVLPAQCDDAFARLVDSWEGLLRKFHLDSGEKRFDRMMNMWNQYQCVQTFHVSRSASYYESGIGRGIGFRDTNQDMLGCMHLIPGQCRQRILDCASTQFLDGSAYHQFQPLTKKGNTKAGSGFHDDPLWLVYAVIAYIQETGDWGILDEPVDFVDGSEGKASLYDHCRASFIHYQTRKGPHALPLIGRADWNDCLNLNSLSTEPGESFQTCDIRGKGTAESVLIAGIFAWIAPQWSEMCRRSGRSGDADEINDELQATVDAVERFGWDGQWFLRAYDDEQQAVGSCSDTEGSIFIEPQGFCSMAQIGRSKGYPRKALNAVEKHLACAHGIQLLSPPFSSYRSSYGEISSYPPGYKENGGIFCHNNPWIVIAEIINGRADTAYQYYSATSPAYREPMSEIHRAEPYVYAQMIAGTAAPRCGEAKNSWLTGTAAWNFVAASQYILGIRPTFDGLAVIPVLPSWMDRVRVKREYRGVMYDVVISRTSKGYEIRVNGSVVTGPIISNETEKEESYG